MRDAIGKLFYRTFDAIGTLSVYFIITEGFSLKYVIALVASAVLQSFLPYKLTKEEY